MTSTTVEAPLSADYKPTRLQGVTDLTVVAPVKKGFIPGAFNAVTYTERLARVLGTLNAIRQASREAALQPNPFVDSIGRFRAIHFFRFAIVPTKDGAQLLLNVTFDGGWEPYMRIIWGPLGTMLDLIFCHCEGYPMAVDNTFDEYARWVRRHEVPSSFFYVDSAATVGDVHYLRELERQIHNEGGRKFDDAEAAALALPAQPPRTIPSEYAVSTSIRVLKAFEALRELFPTNDYDDTSSSQDGILLRFAQELLRDLRVWIAQGLFDPGGEYDRRSVTFESERLWLLTPVKPPPERKEPLLFNPANVQAGVHQPYPAEVRNGVLVLLRIRDPKTARSWLSSKPAPVTHAAEKPGDGIYRGLALTYPGLQRLGIPPQALQNAPREFIEGMEARAGILGDLRSNHPDEWKRPRRNWPWVAEEYLPPIAAIELSTVHVVIQLRTELLKGEVADGIKPLPRLVDAVDALNDERVTGMQVLFVQPMKLNDPPRGLAVGRDHFGYADGLSQPTFTTPATPPSHWNDQIKTGDLYIGYSNSRGDKPEPGRTSDLLFDNGTFLVVRKLRQHPDRFESIVSQAAQRLLPAATRKELDILKEDIKARLMGRQTDGRPLIKLRAADNDFDYRSDAKGLQCPFQSHIRRANPRESLPLQSPPRIARRGMSYGPPAKMNSDKPRGIMFMAYNASIAEQFEVIQRWMTGGNSSGLSSAQSDPFVGVPEVGKRRTFRFTLDDKVVRVDLGDQPLVELEWGMYAFVPSIEALDSINTIIKTPKPAPQPAPPGEFPSDKEGWRLVLESERARDRTWAEVRNKGGVIKAAGYGVLVGSEAEVREVLKDDGSQFSARGYGKRMTDSIGLGYLGMDDVGPNRGHKEQAPDVNQVIEQSISERDAFIAARKNAENYLTRLLQISEALTGTRSAPVHVVDFGRDVLTKLCTDWFGLPDGVLMLDAKRADDRLNDGKARCPGHFLTVSKYVFSPHPTAAVSDPAERHGKLLLEAVERMLRKGRPHTELVNKIISTEAIRTDVKLQAATVAGIMLGFAPTVLANLVSVLIRWAAGTLWEFQQDLLYVPKNDYGSTRDILYEPLLQTMRQSPVPFAVWRTAVDDKPFGTDAKAGDPIIVGLGSAVAAGGDSALMFGGERGRNTHACPGRKMAMGVMLGTTAALICAGTLRRTADPRVITVSGAQAPALNPAG